MEVKLHVTGETTTGIDIIAKVFQAKGRDFMEASFDERITSRLFSFRWIGIGGEDKRISTIMEDRKNGTLR